MEQWILCSPRQHKYGQDFCIILQSERVLVCSWKRLQNKCILVHHLLILSGMLSATQTISQPGSEPVHQAPKQLVISLIRHLASQLDFMQIVNQSACKLTSQSARQLVNQPLNLWAKEWLSKSIRLSFQLGSQASKPFANLSASQSSNLTIERCCPVFLALFGF